MICWCYDDLTLIENAFTGQKAARASLQHMRETGPERIILF
jgi:hypothetical protein